MNSTSNHTPIPWCVEGGQSITAEFEGARVQVASMTRTYWTGDDGRKNARLESQMHANADHIIRCVNNHEELVKILTRLVEANALSYGELADDHALWDHANVVLVNDARVQAGTLTTHKE